MTVEEWLRRNHVIVQARFDSYLRAAARTAYSLAVSFGEEPVDASIRWEFWIERGEN
jgi:hypothetical protein